MKRDIKLNTSSSISSLTSRKEENYKEKKKVAPIITKHKIPRTKKEILEKTDDSIDNNNNIIIESPIYFDEKNYRYEDSGIVTNVANQENENNERKRIKGNIRLSFLKFFIYKFSLGKRYNNIKLYESFREKVISVETLIRNHLNILN